MIVVCRENSTRERVNFFYCLLVLIVSSIRLFATPQNVVLTIDSSSFGKVVSIGEGAVFANNSDVIQYSGAIEMSLDFDSSLERITQFKFVDSSIANSDFTQSFFFIGLGTLVATSQNIVRRFETVSDDYSLLSYDDTQDRSGYYSLIGMRMETYQGQLLLNGQLFEDFSQVPEIGDLEGETMTIELEKNSASTIESDVWDVTLTMTIRNHEVETEPNYRITELPRLKQERYELLANLRLKLVTENGLVCKV